MTKNSFQVGDRVRPANDGEDRSGRILRWTALRGTVKAIYPGRGQEREQGIMRIEVRWDRYSPYSRIVPSDSLERA